MLTSLHENRPSMSNDNEQRMVSPVLFRICKANLEVSYQCCSDFVDFEPGKILAWASTRTVTKLAKLAKSHVEGHHFTIRKISFLNGRKDCRTSRSFVRTVIMYCSSDLLAGFSHLVGSKTSASGPKTSLLLCSTQQLVLTSVPALKVCPATVRPPSGTTRGKFHGVTGKKRSTSLICRGY